MMYSYCSVKLDMIGSSLPNLLDFTEHVVELYGDKTNKFQYEIRTDPHLHSKSY